jgi:mitogen-activated protein kinase kinase kinase 11
MYKGSEVAVKVANSDRCSVESWRTELAVLTQLRHPSLICCLACVEAPLSFGLVLEYCDGGDVCEALRRPTPPGFFLRVAKGVASAAAYLHQAGYMHRDIKSPNVLIDSASGVKLADLGLARSVPQAGHTMSKWGASKGKLTAETGSFRWMAPEVVMHEHYSKSADVHSYAVLLHELLTHQLAFLGRSSLRAALAVCQGHRPTLPPQTPAEIAQLITRAWSAASERPSFREICDVLDHLCPTEAEVAWLDEPSGHPLDPVKQPTDRC